MGIYIKGMTMPQGCPMCPMAHRNAFNIFSGCEAVPDKKYAIRDPEYANSDHRPAWCPLVDVPPHGRLGDLDKVEQTFADIENAPYSGFDGSEPFYSAEDAAQIIRLFPTIIEAEEGE